jgi:hypothetical protein
MTAIRVAGMHGLGDNLHQRAVIRGLIAKGRQVWLDTPWPCVYHDLVGPNLLLTGGTSELRTQAKNAHRSSERRAYTTRRPPPSARRVPPLRVHYPSAAVREHGSVLAAMMRTCRLDPATADFRLPIPRAWAARAAILLGKWGASGKPLMIYRPLSERTEWGGNGPRNPDPAAYAALYRSIRERYFVVSIADLQRDAEWMVGEEVEADVVMHHGQLRFEDMAALFARAALVFTAPGFAVILAQAVGTPNVTVFGGYENASSFSLGARFAPHLALEPIKPCQCFSHDHACDKRMDVPLAQARLDAFLGALACSI